MPPTSEQGVKSIEMAERRWKSKKTVRFSDRDVLAHEKPIKRGTKCNGSPVPAKDEPEAAAEDKKPKNSKKKPGKQQETEDSKNDENVLSHVHHCKRQEVEDVEQLRDIRCGFMRWCKNRMSKHELSSSYNPQSNGHAEQAVKTVKGLLKKTDTKQWFCGYRQGTAAPAAPYAYKRVSDDKLVLHADRRGKVRQIKKDIMTDLLLN